VALLHPAAAAAEQGVHRRPLFAAIHTGLALAGRRQERGGDGGVAGRILGGQDAQQTAGAPLHVGEGAHRRRDADAEGARGVGDIDDRASPLSARV
jgi:hypothetical protein